MLPLCVQSSRSIALLLLLETLLDTFHTLATPSLVPDIHHREHLLANSTLWNGGFDRNRLFWYDDRRRNVVALDPGRPKPLPFDFSSSLLECLALVVSIHFFLPMNNLPNPYSTFALVKNIHCRLLCGKCYTLDSLLALQRST